MAAAWTAEQIIALAPDAASAKAGRDQANLRKWTGLGCDDLGAWGLCQGSGKDPYQTVVDLAEPACKCSCPSRKFPCKHGLGLLLLWVGSRPAFTGEAPTWVGEWRTSRAKRAEVRETKIAAAVERAADPAAQAAAAAHAAKRNAQREQRVDDAIADLGRWLGDLLRHGIGDLPSRPDAFFSDQARRLVDGQAPGLARAVRALGDGLNGDGWQERFLAQLARIQHLGQAWQRRTALPTPLVDDLRQQLGFTIPQEEVLATLPVRSTWTVVGRQVTEDEGIRTARCWLHDEQGRPALILNFAAGNQPLDTSLLPGISFPGELCFFPGQRALRALIRSREAATSAARLPPGRSVSEVTAAFASHCCEVPWLDRTLVIVDSVTPLLLDGRLWLRDATGAALPVQRGWPGHWRLLGWSTGRPLTLAGEFDGRSILPLSTDQGEGVIAW